MRLSPHSGTLSRGVADCSIRLFRMAAWTRTDSCAGTVDGAAGRLCLKRKSEIYFEHATAAARGNSAGVKNFIFETPGPSCMSL